MKNPIIVVLAKILNPQSDTKCDFYKNGALVLRKKNRASSEYIITAIGNAPKVLKDIKSVFHDFQIIDYSDDVIIPSFFDMHFHWVQDEVRQMPKANLLDWLNNFTFPTERKFSNKTYTKKKAKDFFTRLTSCGTLGGACFSSIHGFALEQAMDNALGDFVIGNVLMTMNSPKFLIQKPRDAIELVTKFSKKYKSKYALTPRFAIATDPETMKKTAIIAKKNKSFMQSHLCETKNEIDFVMNLYKDKNGFEKVESYTEIYKKVGMLGKRTIMGHGIHLTKTELEILAKTNTAIAHCPTSNAPIKQKGLGSGLFDFKLIESYNIRWALGSDIGGGPVLSMFDVIRSFVDQNRQKMIQEATYKMGLYRSTLAGAKLLNLEKACGNLNPGKQANFLVLPKITTEIPDDVESILASYINKGRKNRLSYDNLVKKVFYKGHLAFSR